VQVKRCFIFLCFFIGLQANAQPTAKHSGLLTGNVLSAADNKPIVKATIQAVYYKDSSFAKQELTTNNGEFEFDQLPFGWLQLRITAIGFASLTIDSIHLRQDRFDFNLGDIKLKVAAKELAEVVVYAEKPLLENKDGKIIFNAGESALSAGASTAELMKQLPLVSTDANGKILLKGKEPKVLIDDKPVELNAQQLADLLESLPGAGVDKIELLLNPPPQFAGEQGGVINIVTKKGKVGLTGRVTLSYGTRGEASVQGNLGYRKTNFNLSVNLGLPISRIQGSNFSRRENFYRDSTNFFNTDGAFDNESLRPSLRVQADYDLNKQTVWSNTLQSNFNGANNAALTQFANLSAQQQLWRLSQRNNASDIDNFTLSWQSSLKHKGKKPGEQWQVIATYNHGNNHNDRHFFQQFFAAPNQPNGVDSTMKQAFRTVSNNASIRADYTIPLGKTKLLLLIGGNFNSNNFHNILQSQNLKKPELVYQFNPLLSNDFYFYQQVTAVRSNLTIPIDSSFRLAIGAQLEYTNTNFSFDGASNHFWNLLPNLTLRKDLSKTSNMALVFSQTIRRPGITELNPSIDYSDPYNLRYGNPVLSPTLASNWDFNYSFIQSKWNINASIGFNQVKDIYSAIRSLQPDGKTAITYQNIATRKEYEAAIWGGINLNKQFKLNLSAGYSYNEYGEAEIRLFRYRNGGTFYTTINYNYVFSPSTSIDGNARYSALADPQGNSRSNFSTNIGLQQKLFNKRLTLTLNIIDPFTPQELRNFTYGSNFNVETFNSTNTRNFRLSLAYQLNKVRELKKGK
jgi:ferric enterobactin receptor